MNPAISIIIPSLNSPIIDQVISAVLTQEESQQLKEIWVIGKDDSGLLPGHSLLHFLDTGSPVPPGTARNMGIEKATGDLLIFLDSDCIPQPGWLVAHLQAHAAGHPVVGGGVLPRGESYWHLVYNLTLFSEFLSTSQPAPRPFLPTLNLSVESRVIEEVGNLVGSLKRGQDVEWTTRMNKAGFPPWFQPAAAIEHRHNRSTLQKVWLDCARSGFHMRQIRLDHADALQAPGFFRYPRLVWWLSPLIAAGVTARLIGRIPKAILKHPHTIPAIYLTKIAWCWGASRDKEPA